MKIVSCPHCSMDHVIRDHSGKSMGLAEECTRCGCPMRNEGEAKAFMDMSAEEDAEAAITKFAQQSTGSKDASID